MADKRTGHGNMSRGSLPDIFSLSGRVVLITGGAGLLGRKHAETVAEAGGLPVLLDISQPGLDAAAEALNAGYGIDVMTVCIDITQPELLRATLDQVLARCGRLDILINNAANNPRMEDSNEVNFSRLENFPLAQWQDDLAVGLTGAFLCSQVFGSHMAAQGRGVVLNVASDLAVIAPDQRLYRQPGVAEHLQPVKPVTYSVVKTGLIGLTRYLATYWADRGVRVNAISPGGVFNNQPEDFVARLSQLIPMGRMAHQDEYKGAVLFLVSDASSYMTGQNLIIEGGRTVW